MIILLNVYIVLLLLRLNVIIDKSNKRNNKYNEITI